ncbi:MAG: Fe-S cluster assembly protein NifU [Nitrospirae bacterium]|nr:Fe-S cluster assembly protein NifU [Nitrospirota bacterium]
MWEYTEKVRELFLHPKNAGEVKDPDAVGEVGNILCGDSLKLTLKIDKETNRILDAKFQTFGCASAIASSSALTELIKGKTIDEAIKVTNQDIAEYLGGLPREKMHCSVMGREALEAAAADYRGEARPAADEGEIVCKCFGVTDKKIIRVIEENDIRTVEDITNFSKAGGGCGECIPKIEKILSDTLGKKLIGKPQERPKALTNIRKIAMIQEVIEKEVRPVLKADRGDVELIDVEGDKVILSMRGVCAECQMAHITGRNIEKKLKELVSDKLLVEMR